MAHIRQSRPDTGLAFQVKVPINFQGVPSSLGSGSPTPYGHYPDILQASDADQGSGLRVQKLLTRVQGLASDEDSGVRVSGLELRDWGVGFRVEGGRRAALRDDSSYLGVGV